MLKNYLTLAFRNLIKNKLPAAINIFGLSVAIGCSLLVFMVIDLQLTKDQFHERGEQIFLIGHTIESQQGRELWGSSPVALGPALAAASPEVSRAVRVRRGAAVMRHDAQVFEESLWFVDPDFLDLFTFPLKWGQATALHDARSVILSEDLAQKYFGAANPVGQTITLTFAEAQQEAFVVRGVAEPFSPRASFSFNLLLPFEVQRDLGLALDDNWGNHVQATFAEVANPAAADALPDVLLPYLERQHAARPDRPIAGFFVQPLLTFSSNAYQIRGSLAGGEVPQAMTMLFLIGVFLVVLACINYINVAIASAARRAKEIGIRKVVGGYRGQLIAQFLSENLLLCFLALLLGLVLAEAFFLPGFKTLVGQEDSDLSVFLFFDHPHLWLYLTGLLLFTSLVSGGYPAIYIASFAPVSILRGRLKVKGKERFTRTLLTVQFMVSFLAIALAVVMWQNDQYQRSLDWGYDQDHVLAVELQEGTPFARLAQRLAQEAGVVQVAGTAQHLGHSSLSSVVRVQEEEYRVTRLDVGAGYLELMDLRLQAGRLFDPDQPTEAATSVLINETMARTLGWADPVGQPLQFGEQTYTVVGVLQDFHYYNFLRDIPPTLVRLAPPSAFNYLVLRTDPGRGVMTADQVQRTWQALFPDSPLQLFFQDSVFDRAFRDNRTVMGLMGTTGGIALLLSCMGLFGLVVLVIAKKRRDLSVHKVLGASAWQVARLINRSFLRLLLIGIALAAPLAYFVLEAVLASTYRYYVPVGLMPFLVGATVLVVVAGLTIASQVYRAATANPVDALRAE